MKPLYAIGFAGTAKNTGKTTTALKILEKSLAAGYKNAVTSIGYDGEERDHITGLPKPKYYLPQGVIVLTAEECLKVSTAEYRIIQKTDINTSLGYVWIVEVIREGFMALAGPNRKIDLQKILVELNKLGVDFAILDGALNRIIPLTCADGLVLSTGAAFDADIPHITRQMQAMLALFQPPVMDLLGIIDHTTTLIAEDGSMVNVGNGSLLSEEAVNNIFQAFSTAPQYLVIPGAAYPVFTQALFNALKNNPPHWVVFGSPLKLIASGKAEEWLTVIREIYDTGCQIAYLEKVPVKLVTVNPFFPKYNPQQFSYQPAFVDKHELLASVRSSVQEKTVIDLMQPPLPDLLEIIGLTKGENK